MKLFSVDNLCNCIVATNDEEGVSESIERSDTGLGFMEPGQYLGLSWGSWIMHQLCRECLCRFLILNLFWSIWSVFKM